jgi:hypothetical protein
MRKDPDKQTRMCMKSNLTEERLAIVTHTTNQKLVPERVGLVSPLVHHTSQVLLDRAGLQPITILHLLIRRATP